LEIARLRAFLRNHRRIALDTCIFIYQWEANPRYSQLTDLAFSSLERSEFIAITSTITMTELLIHPYRERDLATVNEVVALFSTYPNLDWIAPELKTALRAAEIRAEHRLETPDALQAATAIEAQATAMLTNDPAFKRVPEFQALILDDCL
jgi:predicted nucleic acid-binding protein